MKRPEWTRKKTMVPMVMSILLIGALLLLQAGLLGYVFWHGADEEQMSMERHHVIATGNCWKINAPRGFFGYPYLMFGGAGEPSGRIHVRGTVYDQNKKGKMVKETINEDFIMKRHLRIGEKRWYAENGEYYFFDTAAKMDMVINWTRNGRDFTERLQL